MRIVAGKYKGRTLFEFSKIGVRPTSDKARESLFNIISDKITDAVFLDLFSGTGAMGIEALSRNAKRAVLNDLSSDSVKLIKKNLLKVGAENAEVTRRDAIDLLKNGNERFDFIFSDPPYGSGLNEKAVAECLPALKQGGVLIIEDETDYCGAVPDGLKKADRRKYGRAIFTFFVKE